MLQSRKSIVAAIAAVGTVILLYNFAVADDPSNSKTDSPRQDRAANTSAIPGWVRKEVHIRMPVLVPEGMPSNPAQDIVIGAPPQVPFMPPFPAPAVAPPWVPNWAKQGMILPPVPPFPTGQLQAKSADPGSLKVKDRRMKDTLGRQYLMRERTWTTDGIAHRELTIIDPPPQAGTAATPSSPASGPAQTPQDHASENPATKAASSQQGSSPSPKQPQPQSLQLPTMQATGIGVSTDSNGQTRVYRYYGGKAVDAALQPAAR